MGHNNRQWVSDMSNISDNSNDKLVNVSTVTPSNHKRPTMFKNNSQKH